MPRSSSSTAPRLARGCEWLHRWGSRKGMIGAYKRGNPFQLCGRNVLYMKYRCKNHRTLTKGSRHLRCSSITSQGQSELDASILLFSCYSIKNDHLSWRDGKYRIIIGLSPEAIPEFLQSRPVPTKESGDAWYDIHGDQRQQG